MIGLPDYTEISTEEQQQKICENCDYYYLGAFGEHCYMFKDVIIGCCQFKQVER